MRARSSSREPCASGWPLALPYGRTPASKGDEPCLVTRCNVLGRIEGDPRELRKVKSGDSIRVEVIQNP